MQKRALIYNGRFVSAGILAFIILLAWYLLTEKTDLVNPLFLPSPLNVISAAILLFSRGLINDVLATVLRVMTGFTFSIIVALPVALLISGSKFFRQLLTPYIDFIRYIPVPVLIPLVILFFGIGEEAKIVLLFVGTFFQIVLLFDADLLRVPKDYFDLAFSLNFSSLEKLKLRFYSALPAMYDNMRISLGLCWSYVIIVELVAAQSGIGHMIKEAQRFSLTANVYVGIILMALIGFASDYLFRICYGKFFPYKK